MSRGSMLPVSPLGWAGLVTMLAAAVLVLSATVLHAGPLESARRNLVAAVALRPPAPPPPGDRSDRPLGRPPAVPVTSEPFAFVAVQDGSELPVAYDPCRPVHYVVRPDGAPPRGVEVVHAAIDALSKATGLVFVYDGPTTEAPREDRPSVQKDRYGDRWAPVLVAWSDAQHSPRLAGVVLGSSGSTSYETRGRGTQRYVTGQVLLDGPDLAELGARPQGEDVVRAVVLHELGHLVGLAHVDDELQLMYQATTPFARSFAAGDRQGLAQLGQGRCFDDA